MPKLKITIFILAMSIMCTNACAQSMTLSAPVDSPYDPNARFMQQQQIQMQQQEIQQQQGQMEQQQRDMEAQRENQFIQQGQAQR
jgi:hypothetical protein